MDFDTIKSANDLKKLGNLETLKANVEEIIKPLKFEVNSYEDLYKIIKILKENWLPLRSGPFVSDEKKFVFYLTKLEGKQRNSFLGITDDMYKNKEKAKKWYWKISKIIRPDLSKNSDAFNELKKLYDVMISI